MKKIVLITLLVAIFIDCLFAQGLTCSLMMNTNNMGTFVGRTMEWYAPLKTTRLAVYPIHCTIFSNGIDTSTVKSWESKYGAIVIEETQAIGNDPENILSVASDGINEKGLTAHMLYQDETLMPSRVTGKPAIDAFAWVKYVLTTNATVNEVLQELNNYQIVLTNLPYQGKSIAPPEHFAINDAGGDAAIIEFIGGKMQIYHGPQYTVMTNEPNYPAQLANLEKVKQAKKQYSVAQLPGGADPKNRFVRASFFMESMPQPVSSTQGVAYMEEALDGITVPTFDDKKHPNTPSSDAWEARWRVVYDLKNLNIYFNQNDSGKKVYLKLSDIDFNNKTIRYIELKDVKSDYDFGLK